MHANSESKERIDAEGLPIDAPQSTRFEQILAAGVDLFDQHGFSRTLTEDIAVKAGITKRTLYRYVGSKQLLLFAVCSQLSREFKRISESLPASHDETDSDSLRQIIVSVAEVVLEMHQVVLVYLSERKHFTPEQKKFVTESEEALVASLAAVLRGLMGPSNADLVARGIFGSLLHMARWYRPTGPLSVDLLSQTAAELWVNGVFGVSDLHGYETPGSIERAPEPDLSSVALPEWDASNETQDRILDIATQMFAEAGFDSTSTRNLAETANLTKGSLHYYIERKVDLLLQIHFRVMASSVQALADVSSRELRSGDEIAEIIRLHLTNVLKHHSAIVVFNEESKALGPEHMKQITLWRTLYSRSMERTITSLLAEAGITLPMQHVRVLTLLLLGMLNSVYRWFGGDGEQDVAEVSSALTELFLTGAARA